MPHRVSIWAQSVSSARSFSMAGRDRRLQLKGPTGPDGSALSRMTALVVLPSMLIGENPPACAPCTTSMPIISGLIL